MKQIKQIQNHNLFTFDMKKRVEYLGLYMLRKVKVPTPRAVAKTIFENCKLVKCAIIILNEIYININSYQSFIVFLYLTLSN